MYYRFMCGASHGAEPDWATWRGSEPDYQDALAAFWAEECPLHGRDCE